MEPSKEAIAVRITRLNRQILGKVTGGTNKLNKRTIDRETLFDALTVLYDECNDDPVKKCDDLVKTFVDKYRSTLAELRRTRVCLSDFDVLQCIGRGHFGEVHMVREKETGDVFAMKTLRKDQSRKRTVGAEDERDVLASANSPWIPRLQYAFQDASHLYLVMEICLGGDLAGLLARRNHPLSERDAAFYVAEVAQALKALHSMGYVHRDVKPHNILLDRCGHVKLGDLGSSARLAEGGAAVGTADYAAPEQLAAADCASSHTHTVCLEYCRGIVSAAISACDYWSLGVVAFELVTLRRPFSSGDDDSIAQVLGNIQKYERSPDAQPPWDSGHPSPEWRELVAGLLRVPPARRFAYLDTVRHPALARANLHSIRDQAPPWVPIVRGAEDAEYFPVPERVARPPDPAPFRARPPFAGQLPFVGYSYVAQAESEDTSGGFNASHDCTAIDLATFKSAEKLVAMRGREISSLQNKLAAAEAAIASSATEAAERARRDADAEAERTRAKLQAEITALSLQNKRLERQVEVEKEERMALQRTNQELTSGINERNSAVSRASSAAMAALAAERDSLREEFNKAEARQAELKAEVARALAAAETANLHQQHYKDTIAKERALRRQTLNGGEAESREAAARLAAAEANLARETRAREQAEKRLAESDAENATLQHDNDLLHSDIVTLQAELDRVKKELTNNKDSHLEKQQAIETSSEQLRQAQQELAQERVRVTALVAQVQELEHGVEAAARRESALEEQCARTEARFHERLEAAEQRAAHALQDDARHREKVNTLEQLVRRLEREVSALERRACQQCASRSMSEQAPERTERAERTGVESHSDTESVGDAPAAHAQLALLKEQLERAEMQLQARAEELATLRQEARSANLAKWRKEKECSELSLEVKSSARELKRVEERLTAVIEARKAAEQKATRLESEIATLRPQYERATKDAERLKNQLEKLQKIHETAQAEIDRSRNDIRKLKSELAYSEKRRLHAEEQEELSSRERAHMRDELHDLRTKTNELEQNNKALQEACNVLDEQLTDLEKLADHHELKTKNLESEVVRVRAELLETRTRLQQAERQAAESGAAAGAAERTQRDAREQARQALAQLRLAQERLEAREVQVASLEARAASLEAESAAREAALGAALRRMRDLQEEAAALRTSSHHHHGMELQLQASLDEAQEELASAREAAEAAAAWWRTRETKADATLRQQAKLIDFLQAKVEEANRKKCSLSNRLFGRSSRRTPSSPPLRRANRELQEEVQMLRAKVSALTSGADDNPYPATPKTSKNTSVNKMNGSCKKRKSTESTNGHQDDSVQVVWSDGSREAMRARCVDGALVLSGGGRELKAMLHGAAACDLPRSEQGLAFTVKFEEATGRGRTAAVVCYSAAARASWVSRIKTTPSAPFPGTALCHLPDEPNAALYLGDKAVVIGCSAGLHSLRGRVRLEWDGGAPAGPVRGLALAGGRALLAAEAGLGHAALLALGSAARRAAELQPALYVAPVPLPDPQAPLLLASMSGENEDDPYAAVACGRRVHLLRFDASSTQFKIARSLTVDRAPSSLLLTQRVLYIAGEKPLKINLPSGALETFATDEPIIAAAARKHSPPKAILLVRTQPVEILLCYAECGVFVDENGKRTRNEDPKWSASIHAWEFVHPFLYVIGQDRITIVYLTDEVYKTPPCTCDTASLASTNSDYYLPKTFNLKIKEPILLGKAPKGIIVRWKEDDNYKISVVDGMLAFRSIGGSVESLETVSDSKGSSSDLGQSFTDLTQSATDLRPQDESQESVEPNTGFLADIRMRARQLRLKNRKETTADDVIKEILTTEVGLKRMTNGRKSPATTSEFDSDSTDSTEERTTKDTADVCAEMFTRQVRFE